MTHFSSPKAPKIGTFGNFREKIGISDIFLGAAGDENFEKFRDFIVILPNLDMFEDLIAQLCIK